MNSHTHHPILLVPGYWLGGWVWDGVVVRLTELGYDAAAVTLPGLEAVDAPRSHQRLADHVAAVVTRVRAVGRPVVLVAHSGAGAIATAVADHIPESLARIIYVDSGPVADGTVPRPDLTEDDGELPFPGLAVLAAQGLSVEGLTDADKARMEALAVPQPAGPCREAVTLHNPVRNSIPATVVCCSIPSTMVRDLAVPGTMFAPLANLADLTLVDLPTGHWPMLSRPIHLADVIAAETGSTAVRRALSEPAASRDERGYDYKSGLLGGPVRGVVGVAH